MNAFQGISVSLVLLAAALVAGCSSTPAEDAKIDPATGVPTWILQPPQPTDQSFFYGAKGSVSTDQGLAMKDADQAAKVGLAEIMGQKVQSVYKRYLREVASQGADPQNERVIQETTRLITNVFQSGATIKERQPDPKSGQWFSLAEISFENVAKQMRKMSNDRLKEVIKNSDEAHTELDRILKEEWKKPE